MLGLKEQIKQQENLTMHFAVINQKILTKVGILKNTEIGLSNRNKTGHFKITNK